VTFIHLLSLKSSHIYLKIDILMGKTGPCFIIKPAHAMMSGTQGKSCIEIVLSD